MKRQILISSLILLFVAGFATAATLNVDNINGPYFTIQSAIDDAVSGVDDVNVARGTGTYPENIDFLGKEIDVHSADVKNPGLTTIDGGNNGSVVTFENCGSGATLRGFTITAGQADYGGGIECYNSFPIISNCIIKENLANYFGGGVDLYFSDAVITDCIISNNYASYGGGINSEFDSSAVNFCEIRDNEADDAGGGVSCWDSSANIKSCLITDNIVHQGVGGAIYLWNAGSEISNCTIIDNVGSDNFGGIYCDYVEDEEPTIINSILWNNGDDLYNCYGLVTYSCIEDYDWGQGNIHENPQLIGPYYLSHKAAGQLVNSPCIDAGSADANDPNIGLDQYTTSSDQTPDTGKVDMGYHQERILPVPAYTLTTSAIGSGTIDPDYSTPEDFNQYTIVALTAIPSDPTIYRVKEWTGTDNDPSFNTNTNAVTMDGDKTVTVEFEEKPVWVLTVNVSGSGGRLVSPPRAGSYEYRDGDIVTIETIPNPGYITQWSGTDNDYSIDPNNTITMDADETVTVSFRQPVDRCVPGQYHSIESAMDAAIGGDMVIVSAGVYLEHNLDFQGKAITIASEHPDDPCCIAATIIDCQRGGRAFILQHGEGRRSVIDGFTIINGLAVSGPNTPPSTGGTGGNGQIAYGGAIACLYYPATGRAASPTISNCVIIDCVAQGQNGEDASFVFPAPALPPDPPPPLDPIDPLPDPGEPEPDPEDPNAPVDGVDGEPGVAGANGVDGPNGVDGTRGFDGGDGGGGYGGALYFDANSSPIIWHCTIINCMAIGGNAGYGGQGQDGQDGQGGQDGQAGQDGQNGGPGINGGEQGIGGDGGAGGNGGNGGNGGKGGDGGDGGIGGEALGGAIYFGSNCAPTIRYCTIMNSSTAQGLGNIGGDAGDGGAGGAGGAGGDGGDGGTTDGNGGDGGDGGNGGNSGNSGNGGHAGYNGSRSWGGAIFYGANCVAIVSDTVITGSTTHAAVPTGTYEGGVGGDPNTGGAGGAGGAGGDGDGDGEGGDDGMLGGNGLDGIGGWSPSSSSSWTSSSGGGDYYDVNCTAELTRCKINYNSTELTTGPWWSSGDGGGEDYKFDCNAILNKCEFIGNYAGHDGGGQCFDWSCSVEVSDCNYAGNYAGNDGGGQCFDWSCSVEVDDCNYAGNYAGNDGGGLFGWYENLLNISGSNFTGNLAAGSTGSGGGVYGGGVLISGAGFHNSSTVTVNNSDFIDNEAAFGGGLYWYGDGSEVAISKCLINYNTADHGGGLYWSSGAPTIKDCTVRGNTATGRWVSDIYGEEFGGEFYGGGGGFFCWASDANIEACLITENSASGSGGGVYFGGGASWPILKNCLVTENSAVLDGGGIVSYWDAKSTISNCTIADNIAYDPADLNNGRGGGLSCSYGGRDLPHAYESETTLIDSILWGNTGTNGNQIAIGSDSDPLYMDRPATLTVLYCDIQGGQDPEAIYIEPGRTLNWGPANIDEDPTFVTGPLGDYYLSQTDANSTSYPGQDINSPCVDAGSELAEALGLHGYTTRTDHVPDADIVDMGYHYPLIIPEVSCDFDTDGDVDLADLAILLSYWLEQDCDLLDWCEGTDLDRDTDVDFVDYAIFAQCYAPSEGPPTDTDPPEPDPSTWEIEPNEISPFKISMTATTATDESGYVEYYFKCTSGNCHDSGWQSDPNYVDEVSDYGDYCYTVRTWDAYGNETEPSVEWCVLVEGDVTAPQPDPSTWAEPPHPLSSSEIHMVATTAYDPSGGVQYQFECIGGGGHSSDWQDSPEYTDTGLAALTEYTYMVRTRDVYNNISGYSDPRSATTLP